MTKDYADFQWMWEDFTPSYITPHIWEVTRVTSRNIDTHRELYELMEQERESIEKSMSMQDARRTLQAIRQREKLFTKR